MNKLLKTLSVLAIAVTLFSCSEIRALTDYQKKVDTTVLHLGMSKKEVQEALDKKPDNIVSAIKNPVTNQYDEVVKYSYPGNAIIFNYLLYFSNDRLQSWEEGRPDHSSHPDK